MAPMQVEHPAEGAPLLKNYTAVAIAIAVSIAVYWSALGGGFVYDDHSLK